MFIQTTEVITLTLTRNNGIVHKSDYSQKPDFGLDFDQCLNNSSRYYSTEDRQIGQNKLNQSTGVKLQMRYINIFLVLILLKLNLYIAKTLWIMLHAYCLAEELRIISEDGDSFFFWRIEGAEFTLAV